MEGMIGADSEEMCVLDKVVMTNQFSVAQCSGWEGCIKLIMDVKMHDVIDS